MKQKKKNITGTLVIQIHKLPEPGGKCWKEEKATEKQRGERPAN